MWIYNKSIRVGDKTYVLTPMRALRCGDEFYIKNCAVSTHEAKGVYIYKEGVIHTEGKLLLRCNIKTQCGREFRYSHFRHGAGSYNYDFYKYVDESSMDY